MNLFHSLALTPELQTAISQVQSALRRRADADLAAAANVRNIDAGNALLPELEQTAARLHAEAIKSEALASGSGASKTDVTKAVKAADKAAIDVAEKRREIERATAARSVLADMARDADVAITAAKAEFTSALAAFREQLLAAFEADLREACATLVPVVLAAKAVDADFPGRLCAPLLDNIKLVSPCGYRVSPDDRGGWRVSGRDLLAIEVQASTVPEGAALALREIGAVVDALRRHKPFVPPKPSQLATTEPRRLSAADERWNKEQRQAIENWKPPKGAGPGHSWSVSGPLDNPGRYKPRNAQISSSAAAPDAQSDDHGTLSDEWRRIGALPPDSVNR